MVDYSSQRPFPSTAWYFRRQRKPARPLDPFVGQKVHGASHEGGDTATPRGK